MLKRILIGLGGTPYTDVAIRHAIHLATDHDASVTAASVVDVDRHARVGAVPLGGMQAAMTLAERRVQVTLDNLEASTEAFREAASGAGVSHRVLSETGDPFDLMARLSHAHDLSVFGLRSVFEYGLIEEPRDALMKLLGRGAGPVLGVARPYRPVRKILVGYDGRPEANRAFRALLDRGLWEGAIVRLVHCRSGRRSLGQGLEDVAALGRSHGYPTDFEEISGPVERGLIGYAGVWNADVIVLGHRSRGVLTRSLIGDTVEKMIRLSDRSLLLAG